ncbi:hypothetical protein PUR59_04310 [Streptomyces sp. SP18ES09]|uniref:hypothetical protein n=1 Tax=Streptomyces sp. SP18ES09 TaxID=3002532 RepID=UPI002E784A0E|nr:hypothetical protein [Streptomyces sp. SP18ES09]MEE1814244.1 hypothetical protein [Streptomyces sp. SP18ES09]
MNRPDRVRTDPDLAELAPLAQVIARTLRDTPIRLGDPGAAPDLVGALTAAVAVYIGREVLPPGALDEARPPTVAWDVEIEHRPGQWVTFSPDCPLPAALEWCASAKENTRQPARIVRRTTITTIEPIQGSTGADPT